MPLGVCPVVGFRVIEYINDQTIVTDAGLAQPAGEAPVQDWLASFAAQQNLQRLADTLGQRPLTPLGDVGVAGGFTVPRLQTLGPTVFSWVASGLISRWRGV